MMNKQNTSNEKETKREYSEEEFKEFVELIYRAAALPREAREKVAIFILAIVMMTETKGA